MSSRGATRPPPSASHAPPPTSRLQTETQVRNHYHERLDDATNRAADAFKDLVSSCSIRDRASNARSDYQSQVDAATLAHAADELLRLIAELKVATIVQDVSESKQEASEMLSFYDVETRQALHEITTLKDAVASSLASLEPHYYSSVTRWRTPL